MNRQELVDAILEEWGRTRHNGSLVCRLLVNPPETDDEQDQHDIAFEHEVNQLKEAEAEEIKRRWNVEVEIGQYGRGGATFAPSRWIIESSTAMTLNLDRMMVDLMTPHDYSGLAEYNGLRRALALLRYNNSYWRANASGYNDWWEHIRAALAEEREAEA